ncbi:hypothetical protein [Sphingobacterium arenae]|uniref:Uncharacterized protein n=1 Tax=Sphingobacterium arenae TaxID=1280598 RepID=A0ABR7XZY8_9SPHI|nr:hypothetical protein [Sphingobacterium arenae]MBD1424608.1 hypothetical protein [Sphingobacterium arenae]
MMKFKRYLPIFFTLLAFSACKVESENIFNMFGDIEVTFQNSSEFAVTQDAVVNDGDSVHIYFTVTSAKEDMYSVVVDSTNGTGTWSTVTIDTEGNERRSFSGVRKFKMQRDGKVTFRFYARDFKDEYLGDGYTSITINARPSFDHFVNRRLYAPNENTPELPCFLSLTTGRSYSYSEGSSASAQIDFGIDTVLTADPNNPTELVYNLYSTSVEEYPVSFYDLSGWTQRETLFSVPIYNYSNTNYTRVLVSGSKIQEEAEKLTIDRKQTDGILHTQGLTPNTLLYFLTPEGKYGALYVTQSTQDTDGKPYINVHVKIQK